MKNKIKAGIVGGSGYTGGELLRLLLNHHQVQVSFVHSHSHAGQPVTNVHDDLLGDTDLEFVPTVDPDVDVAFICLPHSYTRPFLEANIFSEHTRIIDLSNEFRKVDNNTLNGKDFVYGLSELNREQIRSAHYIANPGCFATAIQLALLPLAAIGAVTNEVFISALTGSTGAGQSLTAPVHFSWRFANHSSYNVFSHPHINEIIQSLKQLDPDFNADIHFIPQRGAFTRGIHASVLINCNMKAVQARGVYRSYYSGHPFIVISTKPVHLKQVVNTNKCLISVEQDSGKLLVTSVIDNLLKGASGQAVQNMNLMFGLSETAGLKLKPSVF